MIRLVVLDYEKYLEDLLGHEQLEQVDVRFVSSPLEAIELAKESSIDAMTFDCDDSYKRMIDAIKRVKEESPATQILALSSLPSVSDAVKAIRAGAHDFLCKPLDFSVLKGFLQKILEKKLKDKQIQEVSGLSFREGRQLIGQSSGMQQVFHLVRKLSRVDTSVLIRGESGTGKELVAQALHFNSSRKNKPFVAVNCGAIPESLIESELFGYEKGTFTGADKKKIGKFQYAQGGTIFLDEIGDISAAMQVKLLRVLQEKVITPVGSHEEIPIDVRVVSATHKNLEEMMEKSNFRSDLYYRLNVLPICIPPLRERREDIQALCEFMLEKFNGLHQANMQSIEPLAMKLLEAYEWPGNIRELENVIEHAFILESGDVLRVDAFPEHIQSSLNLPGGEPKAASDSLQAHMSHKLFQDAGELKYPQLKEQFEKEFICRALKTFRGRINHTAEQTQMTKVTLLRKLEKYNINPKEFQH